jgi:hypothetical protein
VNRVEDAIKNIVDQLNVGEKPVTLLVQVFFLLFNWFKFFRYHFDWCKLLSQSNLGQIPETSLAQLRSMSSSISAGNKDNFFKVLIT